MSARKSTADVAENGPTPKRNEENSVTKSAVSLAFLKYSFLSSEVWNLKPTRQGEVAMHTFQRISERYCGDNAMIAGDILRYPCCIEAVIFLCDNTIHSASECQSSTLRVLQPWRLSAALARPPPWSPQLAPPPLSSSSPPRPPLSPLLAGAPQLRARTPRTRPTTGALCRAPGGRSWAWEGCWPSASMAFRP